MHAFIVSFKKYKHITLKAFIFFYKENFVGNGNGHVCLTRVVLTVCKRKVSFYR